MSAFPDVRTATVDDLPGLLHLSHLLHDENALFPMDEELVLQALARSLDKRQGRIGVIGERDDLRGAIVLVAGHLWYSKRMCLEEKFNFVRPDYRRTDYAKQLIRYAKFVSNEIELPAFIGILSKIRTEAKERLYERELTRLGAYFVHWPEKHAIETE